MNALQHDRSIHKVFTASATKGADGTHVFTISTRDLDRDGDRIDPNGWDLSAYRQNPIVLFGHDYKSPPIGKCPNVAVVGGKLKGTIEWPPQGCYPFADQVRGLVDAGFLRSASVGFRADRSEPNGFGGHDIKAATLLEWSIVNIPSNASATVERGMDKMRLKSWLGNSWREQPTEDDMPYLELEDEVDVDLVELSQLCYRMLPELAATATTQAIEDLSKNTEPTTEDAFRHMCANMLAAYEEFGSAKFTELMSAQLILHPELNAAVTQALQVAGVVAPKHWRNDDELLDVDERQLTAAIGQVVAQAVGAETRSALCHALGRLD